MSVEHVAGRLEAGRSGHAEHTGRSPRLPVGVLVLSAIWFVLMIVPVDYYRVPASLAAGLRLALLAGGAISVVIVVRALRERRSVVVLVLLALLMGLVAGRTPSGYEMVAALGLGVGVGLSLSRPANLLAPFALALFVLLCVDALLHRSMESSMWGPAFNVTYPSSSYRARGFIGQPVPAASIALASAAFFALSARRRPVVRAAWLIAGAAAILLTGTRSAWFAMLAVLLLLLVAVVRRAGQVRLPLLQLSIGCMILAMVAVVVGEGGLSSGGRALDFNSLAGSVSLTNRSSALAVLGARQGCDGLCWLFGTGVRSLQAALASSGSLNGYSTVDNFYVTAVWDLGLIGCMLLLLLSVCAVRGALTGLSTHRGACAALVVLLVGASFFDLFYTRSCALLVGLLVGIAVRPGDRSTPGGESGFEQGVVT